MNMYVEYYKRFGKVPIIEYREDVIAANLHLKAAFDKPSAQTLTSLKKRGENIITTARWDEITAEAHQKAFTVAGILNADVVQEVFNYMQKAIQDGWSLNTFIENVKEGGLYTRMQETGWTGKNARRLRLIYDTNMKIAAAKGRFDAFKIISDIKPYWIYKQIDRVSKRHDHSLLHNKKFKHNDPIWATIFPPTGFFCSCHVVATANGDGVENGADYMNLLKDNNNFQFSAIKQYEADLTKYSIGIKKELEKIFKKQ